MKRALSFLIKTLPFALGVVLVLTSLAFLVEFTDQRLHIGDLEDEEFWAFVFFAMIGVPTLLYGIKKASDTKL